MAEQQQEIMETGQNTISKALLLIQQRQLGKAIKVIRNILESNPYLADIDILTSTEHDYELMMDFMQRGYKDDKREELYNNLLRKLFRLCSDMENTWKRKNLAPYIEASAIAGCLNKSYDFIKNILESFVTDAAILSLEEENARRQKSEELYKRHQKFIDQLFNATWTSAQWTESDRKFHTGLMLSPTIDTNDILLLTSAVTIGAINQFDPKKLLTLIDVYRDSDNERVRQRALVGLAFSLPTTNTSELFPELGEALDNLCDSKDARRELLELQMQVFLCMNAEKDNSRIQKDIIPTLVRNNNLNITRFGITEKEESSLQDILDPGKADRAMEDVENSIKKMMDMHKAGADIYFGGFSQMKRFPFFSVMSNWLCPFNARHPELAAVNVKLDNSPFISLLFKSGPFCDSDKYSFALAISSIIDKIPANMREMMGNAESLGPAIPQEEMKSAAYIRRMYLQDLYRFYKLYPKRVGLENPFEQTFTDLDFKIRKSYFFVSPLLRSDKLANDKLKLGNFLMKQQRWSEINDLIISFNGNIPDNNVEFYLLSAYSDMNDNLYGISIDMFNKVLEIEPENIPALKGLARASLIEGEYAQAQEAYNTLSKLFPDNKSFKINHCITLLKTGKTDEAMEILYKMDYEKPNDMDVKRVLAWGLLCRNNPEQAKKEYATILSSGKPKKEDYLNAGYCAWFMGDISRAVELFKSFVEKNTAEGNKETFENVIAEDYDIIFMYGITNTDMLLMTDMVNF